MRGIEKFYKSQSGTHEYLDAGGEQTLIEITNSKRGFISGILVDMNNLTKNGTFKLYSKIDGTNYREVDSQVFTFATDSKGALFDVKFPLNVDFKLTYEEETNEGDDRDMPFSYYLEG
jgi:hypothetical protein